MGAVTDRPNAARAGLAGRPERPAKRAPDGGGLAHAPHRRIDPGDGVRRRLARLNERLVMVGYRSASWLFAHLPLAVSWPVVRAMMLAGYVLWPAKRSIITANAAHILGRPAGDRPTRALARRIYQTYARYIVELMRLPSLPEHVPAMLVDADGQRGVDSFAEIWTRYSAQGRGVIAASIHIGSVETLVAAVAARGFPTYALADDTAYPELYALLQAQRRRWGVEVIAWRNLRRTFSVLREPAILGLLVDWGYRADGIPVRLLGDWTTLPAGPAALAAKTGAVIVPVVCRRLPNGRFAAEHFSPIEVSDDSPAELARATQALADAVGEMVRPAPEQWYTFKPIWPAGAAEAAALASRAHPTTAKPTRARPKTQANTAL
jgi:KDO2-lipid IV(A) lauroyltransferase